MTAHAQGELRITSWQETRTETLADGGRFVQVRIEEEFSGDISGVSWWDDLLYYRSDETAAFVTAGQISGELQGRKGSFIVTTTGTFDGETVRSQLTIVPRSGTGELRGISGAGAMTTRLGQPGNYSLDYTLDSSADG